MQVNVAKNNFTYVMVYQDYYYFVSKTFKVY